MTAILRPLTMAGVPAAMALGGIDPIDAVLMMEVREGDGSTGARSRLELAPVPNCTAARGLFGQAVREMVMEATCVRSRV